MSATYRDAKFVNLPEVCSKLTVANFFLPTLQFYKKLDDECYSTVLILINHVIASTLNLAKFSIINYQPNTVISKN